MRKAPARPLPAVGRAAAAHPMWPGCYVLEWGGGSYSSLRSSRCSRSRSLKQPSEAMLSRTSGSSSPFDGRLRMATRRPGVGSRHGSGSCFPPLGKRRIVANRASPSAETQGSRVPACSFLGNPGVRAPASPPSHPGVQAQEFGPNLFSTSVFLP